MKHARIPAVLLALLCLASLLLGCGIQIPVTVSDLYGTPEPSPSPNPDAITPSLAPGVYDTFQQLTLSAGGRQIYYTTALIDPTPAMIAAYHEEGPAAAPYLIPYDGSIQTTFYGRTEIRALAQNNGGGFGELYTFVYDIVPADDRILWWEDPIIEAGIRAWLGRPTGDIYRHELNGIERMAIVGGSVLFNDEALQIHYNNFQDCLILHDEVYTAEPGTLGTLADIGNCAGLKELMIFHNGIASLRGVERLAPLTELMGLQLRETNVADLGPIGCLSGLEGLAISYSPLRDVAPILSLARLESFSASFTAIDDISPLADCGWLKSLMITDSPVTDLRPLNELTQLEALYINCLPARLGDIRATFPYLMQLYIDETQYDAGIINSAFPILLDLGIFFEGKPQIDVRKITRVNPSCRVLYIYDTTAQELNPEASFLERFAGWSAHVHR